MARDAPGLDVLRGEQLDGLTQFLRPPAKETDVTRAVEFSIGFPAMGRPVDHLDAGAQAVEHAPVSLKDVDKVELRGTGISARIAVDDEDAVGGDQRPKNLFPPGHHFSKGNGIGRIDAIVGIEKWTFLKSVLRRLRVLRRHVGTINDVHAHLEIAVRHVDHRGDLCEVRGVARR